MKTLSYLYASNLTNIAAEVKKTYFTEIYRKGNL